MAPASSSSEVVTPSKACNRCPLTVCAWLCKSTNPGATTHPAASRMVRPRRLGPIAATRVSSIARSTGMSTPWPGSTTRPPRITRGYSTVCSASRDRAAAPAQPDRPAAAHPSRNLRRSSVGCHLGFSIGRSLEAVLAPAHRDALADLVRHADLLRPRLLHAVERRPLLGRVDAELPAVAMAEGGVVEV